MTAPYANLSDAEVMLRAGTGDDQAFAFLVEKFRRPMISFMYRSVGNSHVAEELAQETFVRVWQQREKFRIGAEFKPWVFSIAVNLARNRLRWSRLPCSSMPWV